MVNAESSEKRKINTGITSGACNEEFFGWYVDGVAWDLSLLCILTHIIVTDTAEVVLNWGVPSAGTPCHLPQHYCSSCLWEECLVHFWIILVTPICERTCATDWHFPQHGFCQKQYDNGGRGVRQTHRQPGPEEGVNVTCKDLHLWSLWQSVHH